MESDKVELVHQAQQTLGFPLGETDMWISDVPGPAADTAPAVLIARAAGVNTTAVSKTKNVLGVCATINGTMPLYTGADASTYLYKYHHIDGAVDRNATSTILVPPKRGVIEDSTNDGGWQYRSTADSSRGYNLVTDSFVIRVVTGKGITVDVHYFVYVQAPDESHYEYCKKALWKISSAPVLDNAIPNDFALNSYGVHWKNNLAAYDRLSNGLSASASPLATALPRALQSLASFADLADSAVGETTGAGPSTQITLDTTAAGHGWYIDATPYLNEEYLPTVSATFVL